VYSLYFASATKGKHTNKKKKQTRTWKFVRFRNGTSEASILQRCDATSQGIRPSKFR